MQGLLDVTAIKTFNEGYNCGFTWPDVWELHGKPGGPAVFVGDKCPYCSQKNGGCDRQVSPRFTCKESLEFSNRSQLRNRMWVHGWEEGHKEKRRLGLSFTVEDHKTKEDELNKVYEHLSLYTKSKKEIIEFLSHPTNIAYATISDLENDYIQIKDLYRIAKIVGMRLKIEFVSQD